MTILADEGDVFWCGLKKWTTGQYVCEFCAYTCRGTDLPEEDAKRLFCKHVDLGPPKSPTTGMKKRKLTDV